MDRQEIEENWNHWKNGIQMHWNKLTSGDIYQIDGMFNHLIDIIVKRYGWSREIAEKEIENWHPQWSDSSEKKEIATKGSKGEKQAKKANKTKTEIHEWQKPKEAWKEHPGPNEKKRKAG